MLSAPNINVSLSPGGKSAWSNYCNLGINGIRKKSGIFTNQRTRLFINLIIALTVHSEYKPKSWYCSRVGRCWNWGSWEGSIHRVSYCTQRYHCKRKKPILSGIVFKVFSSKSRVVFTHDQGNRKIIPTYQHFMLLGF